MRKAFEAGNLIPDFGDLQLNILLKNSKKKALKNIANLKHDFLMTVDVYDFLVSGLNLLVEILIAGLLLGLFVLYNKTRKVIEELNRQLEVIEARTEAELDGFILNVISRLSSIKIKGGIRKYDRMGKELVRWFLGEERQKRFTFASDFISISLAIMASITARYLDKAIKYGYGVKKRSRQEAFNFIKPFKAKATGFTLFLDRVDGRIHESLNQDQYFSRRQIVPSFVLSQAADFVQKTGRVCFGAGRPALKYTLSVFLISLKVLRYALKTALGLVTDSLELIAIILGKITLLSLRSTIFSFKKTGVIVKDSSGVTLLLSSFISKKIYSVFKITAGLVIDSVALIFSLAGKLIVLVASSIGTSSGFFNNLFNEYTNFAAKLSEEALKEIQEISDVLLEDRAILKKSASYDLKKAIALIGDGFSEYSLMLGRNAVAGLNIRKTGFDKTKAILSRASGLPRIIVSEAKGFSRFEAEVFREVKKDTAKIAIAGVALAVKFSNRLGTGVLRRFSVPAVKIPVLNLRPFQESVYSFYGQIKPTLARVAFYKNKIVSLATLDPQFFRTIEMIGVMPTKAKKDKDLNIQIVKVIGLNSRPHYLNAKNNKDKMIGADLGINPKVVLAIGLAEYIKWLSPTEFTKNSKEYTAVSVLAKDYGYERDHLGYLARGGKIDGLKIYKKWYVVRQSLADYREMIKEQNSARALERIQVVRQKTSANLIFRPLFNLWR